MFLSAYNHLISILKDQSGCRVEDDGQGRVDEEGTPVRRPEQYLWQLFKRILWGHFTVYQGR